MSHFNEHALELSIMELFQQEGYTYTSGEEIHKEVSDVLLRDDMRLYLRNRYKANGITPLEIERILATLTANVGFSLYEQNRHTYRLMTEGFSLKREDAALPDLFIEPIDFSKEGIRFQQRRHKKQSVPHRQSVGDTGCGTTYSRWHCLCEWSARSGVGVQECREGRDYHHGCLYPTHRTLPP